MTPDDLPDLTEKQLEEARYLAALPDHRFDEEVGNYVRRPAPGRRDVFRSALLVARTAEALARLRARAEQRRKASGDKRLGLADFVAACDAEARAVKPYLQGVRARRGRRWRALLRLALRYPDDFVDLLDGEGERDQMGAPADWVEEAERRLRAIADDEPYGNAKGPPQAR